MTDQKLLTLLGDYLHAQLEIVETMAYARLRFKSGDEQSSWVYLLEWAEAQDRRDALWKILGNKFLRAVDLKEGLI